MLTDLLGLEIDQCLSICVILNKHPSLSRLIDDHLGASRYRILLRLLETPLTRFAFSPFVFVMTFTFDFYSLCSALVEQYSRREFDEDVERLLRESREKGSLDV